MTIKAQAQELMKEAELELIVAVEKETQVAEEDKPTTIRTKSIDSIDAFFYV
jgi:lipopolysaccharide export system protein LptC